LVLEWTSFVCCNNYTQNIYEMWFGVSDSG
jgi:hypothetical protein